MWQILLCPHEGPYLTRLCIHIKINKHTVFYCIINEVVFTRVETYRVTTRRCLVCLNAPLSTDGSRVHCGNAKQNGAVPYRSTHTREGEPFLVFICETSLSSANKAAGGRHCTGSPSIRSGSTRRIHIRCGSSFGRGILPVRRMDYR